MRQIVDRFGGLPAIRRELIELRDEMLTLERHESGPLQQVAREHLPSARNLLHYVALRRRDLRGLQLRLAELGMSSIGRSEAHVLSSVDNVIELANRLLGEPGIPPNTAPCDLAGGARLLAKRTQQLLGPTRSDRPVRIMVTMPSEAAGNSRLIRALLKGGMDCMRINCAHDDAVAWRCMIDHLDRARTALGRGCTVLMDLPGPKLRTGKIGSAPAVVKIRPRRDAFGRVIQPARIWIGSDPAAQENPQSGDAHLSVDAHWLSGIERGSKIRLLDTRGRRRRLKVCEVVRGGVWALLDRTAYVTNGTVLTRAGGAKESPTRTQIHGIPPGDAALFLEAGDALILTPDPNGGTPAQMDAAGKVLRPAAVPCSLPEVLVRVKVGDPVSLDDGKFAGAVEALGAGTVRIRLTHAPPKGALLKADKGINFADTELGLSAITDADTATLDFIAKHADLIGLSFVNDERDVTTLLERLRRLTRHPPGIVLKIETKRGFDRLPSILLSAMRHPHIGVMIARGDLAVECGYERLAELQEEILWMCEAAHCPAIWATQVLDSMAKKGTPTRAEITDAAMSQRAECVMLNKGPHVAEALEILDHILKRMDPHQSKKSARLRALKLAQHFAPDRGPPVPPRRRNHVTGQAQAPQIPPA